MCKNGYAEFDLSAFFWTHSRLHLYGQKDQVQRRREKGDRKKREKGKRHKGERETRER
jgi:hypothetical protein